MADVDIVSPTYQSTDFKTLQKFGAGSSVGDASTDRNNVLYAIAKKILDRRTTLAQEISLRNLYLRVSVIGACNLSCPFCHNEGGPNRGLLELKQLHDIFRFGRHFGFNRLQFTGGEPLIRHDIDKFINIGRKYFNNVGVTTNGTYLAKRIDDLILSGINRIHISLQEEELMNSANAQFEEWRIPKWLISSIETAIASKIVVRINLPVAICKVHLAEEFLSKELIQKLDIQMFALLPSDHENNLDAPSILSDIASRQNTMRSKIKGTGRVTVRSYTPPVGLRCKDCASYASCRENSRSLRFGVDRVFRPCLASREWDVTYNEEEIFASYLKAVLFSLDYVWPPVGPAQGCWHDESEEITRQIEMFAGYGTKQGLL